MTFASDFEVRFDRSYPGLTQRLIVGFLDSSIIEFGDSTATRVGVADVDLAPLDTFSII